jgi:phosphate/sulfate permease
MVQIEESTGLICGFLIASDGSVAPIGWNDMDRALILAWVLTLPMSIVIAGVLYWTFRMLFAV